MGAGGFSRVYRGYQRRYDRVVAIKVLTAAMDDDVRRRFFRECALTGRLTGHPHIVTILDSGVTPQGQPYLTTEFFDGGSLAERVRARGPLALAEALAIGVKIGGALETAHQAGVHHRDVKPQNILLSRFDEPALGDFGISTTVRDQGDRYPMAGLTMVHAPPEVLDGSLGDATADVYSLASTVYHALAGRSAFATGAHGDDGGIEQRIRRAAVPPIDRADVPATVMAHLADAMAKQPGDRPASPLELARRLQRAESEAGLPVTPVICPGVPPAPDAPAAGPTPLVVALDHEPSSLVVELDPDGGAVRPPLADTGVDDEVTDPRPRRTPG